MKPVWLYFGQLGYCGIALYSIVFFVLPVRIFDDLDNKALTVPSESVSWSPTKMTIRTVCLNIC